MTRQKQLQTAILAARAALAKVEKALESVKDEGVCEILCDVQQAAEGAVSELESELEDC